MRALTELEKARLELGGKNSFAARAYALLNRPRKGKFQYPNGAYGERTTIGLKHFDSHLKGHDSIALSSVHGEKANFLAIDIDAAFERRLVVVADVLRKRGFDRAAFAINGSDPGRGKVVVTLRQRLPQRQAVRLVQDIASDAIADMRFGGFTPKELTTFPSMGDGSHVRLFGRNRRRVFTNVIYEVPLDVKGELTDLFSVQPADILPEHGTRAAAGSLSSWAQAFTTRPYVGSTPDLFKAQVRLAHEAFRLYGADAKERLSEWFHSIADLSVDLSASARRNLLRSDVAATVVRYANATTPALWTPYSSDYIWCPKINVEGKRPAVRVYRALGAYVLDNDLDPNCFGMTYDRIADLTGYSGKTKAREALLLAADACLVVRLDAGVPRQDTRAGLCGLYALVGEGSNAAHAFEAGASTPMYRARSDERARLGLPLLPFPIREGFQIAA